LFNASYSNRGFRHSAKDFIKSSGIGTHSLPLIGLGGVVHLRHRIRLDSADEGAVTSDVVTSELDDVREENEHRRVCQSGPEHWNDVRGCGAAMSRLTSSPVGMSPTRATRSPA
jgi:hypothetical protein